MSPISTSSQVFALGKAFDVTVGRIVPVLECLLAGGRALLASILLTGVFLRGFDLLFGFIVDSMRFVAVCDSQYLTLDP
jgi:hypothetical protein